MEKNTILDVLIPAKNEEKYIEQCLQSIDNVLAGSKIKARIVLVNDRSKDDTVFIAKKCIDKLPNLKLQIINVKNILKGDRLSGVLNQGLPYIESPVFLRLDADMAITKNMLLLYKRIENDETIGAIGGKMPCLASNIINETFNIILGKYLLGNGLFRTELVKQIGYHSLAQDTFLYGKIQEYGYRIEFVNILVGNHLREHTVKDFKKIWKRFTIANIQLGFPRWYPFARIGIAMLRCLRHRNLRAFLLCFSIIGCIQKTLQEYRINTQKVLYWKNGQFNLKKYRQLVKRLKIL
ncbi:MAG: glycosyltransferase [Methanosarcinales archaeon]